MQIRRRGALPHACWKVLPVGKFCGGWNPPRKSRPLILAEAAKAPASPSDTMCPMRCVAPLRRCGIQKRCFAAAVGTREERHEVDPWPPFAHLMVKVSLMNPAGNHFTTGPHGICINASMAQLAERMLSKHEVLSSNLSGGIRFWTFCPTLTC